MSISDWITWFLSWIVFLFSAAGNLLNYVAESLDSYEGLITAVATVILVAVTAKYVQLTSEMVEETKASRGPTVFADLKLDQASVVLLVGNTGLSPAHDLKLKVTDSIPWSGSSRHSGFDSLIIIQTGISYLAPNRILQFRVGFIELQKVKKDGWGQVEMLLTFKNNSGHLLESKFLIDLDQYIGVGYASFDTEVSMMRKIATEITGVKSAIERGDQQNNIFGRMIAHKITCPVCGEAISPTAKKCPHCLEFIQVSEEKEVKEEE